MKKLLWSVLVLAAVWGIPRLSHPAVDIGKLEPVEAVRLTGTGTGIRVETDSGRMGEGASLSDAVKDLKESSSAEIFLDTADKLIVLGDVDAYWEEIYLLFRPVCQVCRGDGELDLEEAERYMKIHPSDQTLAGIRGGLGDLPVLKLTEGRGRYDAG